MDAGTPPGARDAERGIGFALAYGGAFGWLTSAWMAALFAAARSGLPTPGLLVAGCLALFTAFAFAPFAAPARARAAWPRMPCLAAFASLAALFAPIAALAIEPLVAALVLPVAALGLRGAAAPLRRSRAGERALLAAGPPLLALYLFASIHPFPFAHVFPRELALLDQLTGDTALHAALAHLLQSAGRASSGLDGFVPIHYHLASHAWFAGLGRATGAPPLLSYPAGMAIAIAPALPTALFLAVACLAPAREGVAGRMLAALALVLAADRIGWEAYYLSESHALGLCALLLGLPFVGDLLAAPERRGPADALRLLGALVALAIAAATKISCGAIYAVVLGWAIARLYGASRRSASLLAALAGVLLLSALLSGPRAGAGGTELFAPLDFYRRFDPFGAGGESFLDPRKAHSSLLLPLAFVAASALAWRARRRGGRAAGPARGRPGPAELVAVATLAAVLPGLVLALAHDAWWFQNAAHWVALAFATAALPLSARSPARRRAIAAASALVVLVLGAQRLREIPRRIGAQVDLVVASAELAQGEMRGLGVGRVRDRLRDPRAWRRALFPRAVVREIEASPISRIAGLVEAAKSGRDPRAFAVYVPPGNRAFWGGKDVCQKRPFLIPALTGIPMLKGVPRECPVIGSWGAFCCRDYGPESFDEELAPGDLCAHAARRGIASVFVLRSVDEPDRNEVLRCGRTAEAG